MKTITIIGHFAWGEDLFDGQTIKTRIVYQELSKQDQVKVERIDTRGWRKKPFRLLRQISVAAKKSDHIIMMPDRHGFRVFVRVLPFFVRHRRCKLEYSVIGGWLPDFLAANPGYLKYCRQFDAILPETQYMAKELEKAGLQNITVIPNFKPLHILEKPDEITAPPYRFCVFSRITEKKGIADAVECVKRINENAGETVATLDLYGEIDAEFAEAFQNMMDHAPSYIRYCGTVEYSKSVETLRRYYALLFPTKLHNIEGIPGTVIDAFSSGIPVFGYQWQSGSELITNGKEGILSEVSIELLTQNVEEAIRHPENLEPMRWNCLKKAQLYTPEENTARLMKLLDTL